MKKAGTKQISESRRSFLFKAAALGTTVDLAAGAASRPGQTPAPRPKTKAGSSFTGRRPEDYRVILQDIGEPFLRMKWPPTPEKLVAASTEPLRGSAIDAYAYGIHHAGGATHCSTVYPIVGDDQPTLRSANALRLNEAVKHLCEAGHEPLRIMCDGSHKAGLDFFLRLRMNDLHDRVGDSIQIDRPTKRPKTGVIEPYYYTPQWKRDHPEWLIGDPQAPHPPFSYSWFEGKAGNYAIGAFRELMFSLAAEAIGACNLDGFELDFIRFPFLFVQHEAYAQRHVMTAFIRRIRDLTKEQAARRGRPIFLAARVPSTVEQCLRIGMDLPAYLQEGLLDMLIIGGGYLPFGTPWEEVGKLAARAGVPALACFNDSYARGVPRRERGHRPEPSPELQREHLRAAAYRALSSGMSGIELFNFFYQMEDYFTPGEAHLGYDFTHDIANIEFLRKARKSYLLDRAAPLPGAYSHINWSGQVPLQIGEAADGIGHAVVFDIADDLSRASANVRPRLWLHIGDLAPDDKIEFRWNGKRIEPDPNAFRGVTVFDSFEFEFQLAARDVLRGPNQLGIRLLKRNPRLEPFVTLVSGRLTIPEA